MSNLKTGGHPACCSTKLARVLDGVGAGRDATGPVISNLKTGGLRELLEQLAQQPSTRVSERGGPQLIPRPSSSRVGGPAPWSVLPPDERTITPERLRDVFAGRRGAASFVEAAGNTRPSAVLAPFYVLDDELRVVLTRRSWGLRSHTGEVSFPGGGVDPGESLVDAALREAFEEISLDPTTVEVLGELDHLMTVTSRSFIVPFVALLPDVPTCIRARTRSTRCSTSLSTSCCATTCTAKSTGGSTRHRRGHRPT